MAQEIIYTSAPQGLRPGTYGFCTVATTSGMLGSLVERLEALSGYHHVYPPGDPRASLNPVVFSHLMLKLNARRVHVLSRIADAGLDYSQRSNKLAHHVVLDDNELPAGGPAWLLAQAGVLETAWSGAPRNLAPGKRIPQGNAAATICGEWARLTGDAGCWAAVLAQHAHDARRPAYVIVPETSNSLLLIQEALALLPPWRRWEVSFSTCFMKVPAGVECNWRCVLAGSAEAQQALALRGDVVIDATRQLGAAPDGPLTEAARTGRIPPELSVGPPPALATVPQSSPPQLPGRPSRSRSGDEGELKLAPPPMPAATKPPVIQPPTPAGPPQMLRQRRWVITGMVIAMPLLLIAGVGIGYFLRDLAAR